MEQTDQKKVKGEEFLQRVGKTLIGSPSQQKSPEDEATEYKKKTEAVKARSDYVTTVEDLNNPPSVKVIQEQRVKDADEERKAAEQRANDAADRERQRTEDDRKAAMEKAAAEEQKRIQAENDLKGQQNQMLLDKLDELKKSQKPISEQFTEYFNFAEDLAKKMGFERPSTGQPQSENPQIALEIAKINAESAQKDREFQLQLKESDRKWDMEIMKLNDNRAIEQAKLAQQGKRDDALFQAPQAIGAALAQGLVDRQGEGGIRQQPGPQTFKFQATEGDSGEVDCPVCASRGTPTKVGIGPHSDLAECVNCNTKFKIERVPATTEAEEK